MPNDPIGASVVSVGTSTTKIVDTSVDSQIVVVKNLQPGTNSTDYAREGYLYVVQQQFTVAQAASSSFSVTTGSTGLQIEFFEIVSTVSNVKAELLEGATITTTGSAIPAYNLNRNGSDAHNATFFAASAVTGGTVVSAEFITADKHAAGGGKGAAKIITLEPSTQYALRFNNQGNQDTSVFVQIAFAEKYNGYNDVWLGGTVGNGLRLRGGESMQLPMIQGQTLSAIALSDNEVGVLRQD